MAKDFYEILWLQKWASSEDIKKAYRKLAMQYHPDRTGWDTASEAKFKEVNEAYATLSDPQKKQQYDMFGSAGWSSFGGFGWGFQAEDLGDIFSSFFGGGFSGATRGRRTEQRGEDLEYDLHIDLKTSIYGGKQKIEFNRRDECSNCQGEGGSGKKTCDTCNGRGQVVQTTQSPFGVIQQTRTCPECQGSGETFEHICSECQWEKRVLKKHKMDIDIPAGIDDSMVIKMTGEGNAWVGTKASGDLYIRFHVNLEEKWLSRDGIHLHYDLEIDLVEAILGTKKEVQIPILGKRTIVIEAGTQAESILKISGDGVKEVQRDHKGDLLLHIHIPIPKKLGKNERELYTEIAKEKKINVLNKKGVLEKLFG